MNIAFVIPAFNPSAVLVELVESILQSSIASVIVVDDGSNQESQEYINRLNDLSRVVILRHTKNCGKGVALKNAFIFVHKNFKNVLGIVTLDADGQHRVKDVFRIASKLEESKYEILVLGMRAFSSKVVPLRSRIGNQITRFFFRKVTGQDLVDTQTGLRGIPSKFIPEIYALPGRRFEFELEVLLYWCLKRLPIVGVQIMTIYKEGNKTSHFDPVLDSLRVYKVLLGKIFRKEY